MSILSKYLWGAGTLTAQAVVQRLLGGLTSIILARGLGATSLGTYSAVISTASSAYGMVRLGVDAAIHVYTARRRQDAEASKLTGELLGAGLCLLAIAGFIAAIMTAVSAEWLAVAVFGQASLVGPLKFAGILTALQCASQFSYVTLAGFQAFATYAKLMVLNAILILTLSGSGMLLYGVYGALGGYGIAQFILAVSLGHAATRAMREQRVRISYSRFARAIASLLRLGLPFYASGIIAVPVTFFLQGLLSRSAGLDALGQLRVIAAITAIIAFIPTSVAAATTSTLSRARGEPGTPASKVFDYAFLHLKAVLYLTTIMAITLAMLTPLIIETLFGSEYAVASRPGTMALFSTALLSTSTAAWSLFFAMERSRAIFWQSFFQSLVLALLGLLLIPAMGVLGYIGAELTAHLVGLVFILTIALRLSGCEWRRSHHAHAFVLCILAVVLSALIVTEVFSVSMRYSTLVLVMVLTTLGMLRFGLTKWEFSIINRLPPGLRRGTR